MNNNPRHIIDIHKELFTWDRPHLEELITLLVYALNSDPNRAVDLELTVHTKEYKDE